MNLNDNEFFTEHSVEICSTCKGLGLREWEEVTNYHRGDTEICYETCKNCNGTGRIFKTKKWLTHYEPFNPKKLNKNVRIKLKNE